MGYKSLRVLQCNVMRSHASHHELVRHFMSSDFIAALISEPYVGSSKSVHSIQGVHIIQFPSESRVKACVLVKQNAGSVLGLSQYSTPNLSVVQLRLQQRPLLLASAYIEPDDDPSNTLAAINLLLQDTKSSLCVLGMDANGSHPLWGCDSTDTRGEALSDVASSSNFFICNQGRSPTFEAVRYGKHCSSIVDITLASEHIADRIMDWKVSMDACPSSDHNAIEFTISPREALASAHRSSTYLYNNKTARWDIFSSKLQFEMTSSGLPGLDIGSLPPAGLDEVVNRLTQVLRRTCKASMKLRGNVQPYNPWWTQELDDLKKSVIKQHHHLHKIKIRGLNTSEAAEELVKRKQLYSKSIRKASTANFRSFCEKQGKEDVWTLTNRLIKDSPSQQAPSTLKCASSFTTSSEETASALLNHFYPDDTEDSSPYQKEIRQQESMLPDTDDDPAFTAEEILECLQTMNPNRAPGHDNLTSDICLEFVSSYPEFTTSLMNRCLEVGHFPLPWKEARVKILPKPGREDYKDLGSYRPIGLLPVFGKLLEKLFTKRITYCAQTQRTWSKNQFGFREQTTTSDALGHILSIVKDAKSKKHQAIGVSLDIKAAFDNAWWPLLLHRLRRTQCPRNLFCLIQSYLRDRTATLDFGDARASKALSKGCVQGSVCGPTFWNLILDELLEIGLPDGCHIQAFADDVFLTVTGKTASDVKAAANQALDSISNWGRNVKLTFSPTKTQAIYFTPASKNISLSMNDTEIPMSSQLKLLGVILDSNLNFIAHAKYIVQKASKVFKNLCKFVRPTWGVHPSNVETIYKHVVQPMITYAAGVWGHAVERASIKRLLRSFQRSFAIRAIRAFHTVSAVSASALAQFVPLHLKVLETYKIEQVKKSGLYSGLPEDVDLEQRVRPERLLHPSQRQSINPSTARTQDEADSLSSPTNIYTDGSKLDSDDVGSAFVVIHPSGRTESRRFRLDQSCSVFQAELLALDEALKWTQNYAKTNVTIFTDSLSSVEAIKNRSNVHPLVNSIHRRLHSLLGRLTVQFVWVKAHVGIQGNEQADSAAKEAASLHRAKVYTSFPLSYAKRLIRQETMNTWQEEYSSSETGSTTRMFFPTLESIRKFRAESETTFELTQFLTGHGFHKQYLKRFHLTSTDICHCGEDSIQDVTHLLTSCNRYVRQRQDYLGACSEEGVQPFYMPSIVHYPHLIEKFINFVTFIVRTLKSFNNFL